MTDRDDFPDPQYVGVFPSRRRHDRADDEWVDPRDVLDRLRVLPVHAWQEAAEDASSVSHLGPAAEDFYEVFEVGTDADSLSAGAANGVAVAAIQGLAERVDEQDELIERQTRRTRRQQDVIDEQRADIEALREQLEALRAEISRQRLDAGEED